MTREYLSQPNPETPRPAATVMLVRDEAHQLEVFMMQRTAGATFGGFHVFPGGKVEQEDSALESICYGLDDHTASARLGLKGQGLTHWVACIRECFEEAGLLLAVDASGELVCLDEPERRRHFSELRQQLNLGERTIGDICRSEHLLLAVNRLAYSAHWITPEAEKRRFDTRFFVALAPPEQEGVHDGSETVDSLWISPAQALDKMADGTMNMIPPTYMNLQILADFDSTEAVLQHFSALEPGSVETISPRVFTEDGTLGMELAPGQDIQLSTRQ